MSDQAEREESTRPSTDRHRNTVVLVLAVLLIVVTVVVIRIIQQAPAAGAGGPGGPSSGLPPAAVYVTQVTAETTRDEAIVTGTLRAQSRASLAVRESGTVNAMLVDEGDVVKAGAEIARLDQRRVRALLAETKAALASAQTLIEQRRVELARAGRDLQMKRELHARKGVSQSDLLDAETASSVAATQLRVAEDGVREAQSRIDFLEVQLSDLVVTAPFDGVILTRNVEPGEWVAAGGMAASMVSLDPIEAWLRVPARYLPGENGDYKGFRVRRSSTGEIMTPTRITTIPDVDGRSQLFTLVGTLANPGHRLTPGESVTGIVPVGVPEAHWKLPVNAVVQSPMGMIVQVVQKPAAEGTLPTARSIAVQVAFERGGFSYAKTATSDLQAGDQVVVEGNERLQPGQPLLIQPAREAPQSPAP